MWLNTRLNTHFKNEFSCPTPSSQQQRRGALCMHAEHGIVAGWQASIRHACRHPASGSVSPEIPTGPVGMMVGASLMCTTSYVFVAGVLIAVCG